MVAESIGTIQKMFVDDPASPFNIFKEVCEYVGGNRPHFRITGRYSTKRIYLGGFGTARDWKKILGLNIHGIHIEEMSAAHDDFIREAFVRVSRLDTKPWMNASTNGSNPEDIFYKDFFDKSYINPKYNSDIPQITLNYMAETPEKDSKFEYIYFGFKDSPSQSEETIENIMNMFPVGSFFYMSKAIGARGFSEGAIYSPYMERNRIIIPYDDIFDRKKYDFIKYTIGVDVGVSDHSVFTLVGITRGFKESVVIDYFKINNAGSDQIYEAFTKWYKPYHDREEVRGKVHGVFFDMGGGGAVLKKSIESKLLNDFNLQSAGAYKKRIVERIEANVKFIHADRFKITTKAEPIYKAFVSAVYTKDKTKTDPRVFPQHINKDKVDSVEYAQSPFMDVMLRTT